MIPASARAFLTSAFAISVARFLASSSMVWDEPEAEDQAGREHQAAGASLEEGEVGYWKEEVGLNEE